MTAPTLTLLHSKIHRATVTGAELHYDGSLTVDKALMIAAHMVPYQQIDIYNVSNGARLTTYIIEGEANSGVIQANGAAAHHIHTGDLIIIAAYIQVPVVEANTWQPTKIFVDHLNHPKNTVPDKLPVGLPR